MPQQERRFPLSTLEQTTIVQNASTRQHIFSPELVEFATGLGPQEMESIDVNAVHVGEHTCLHLHVLTSLRVQTELVAGAAGFGRVEVVHGEVVESVRFLRWVRDSTSSEWRSNHGEFEAAW
jgi:hypothetical protein